MCAGRPAGSAPSAISAPGAPSLRRSRHARRASRSPGAAPTSGWRRRWRNDAWRPRTAGGGDGDQFQRRGAGRPASRQRAAPARDAPAKRRGQSAFRMPAVTRLSGWFHPRDQRRAIRAGDFIRRARFSQMNSKRVRSDGQGSSGSADASGAGGGGRGGPPCRVSGAGRPTRDRDRNRPGH